MIWVKIDRSSPIPLYRQLHEQLANRILNGKLKGGDRLPSTREFAHDIGISRNVITEVYDQLYAEGFIETRRGSGTFVAKGIHIESFVEPDLSERPDSLELEEKVGKNRIKFQCGVPDAKAFPRDRWFRCLRQELFYGDVSLVNYGEARGTVELRRELCRYLAKTKNIRCSSKQVFIVSGTSQALLLLTNYFRNSIPVVYIEDPVVDYVPEIFSKNNFRLFPIDVDHQGMRVEQLKAAKNRGLVFVSPSHQFPTGSVLPIQRRIELIKTARLQGHFIIEDDYDSEFRFEGTPIQSLHMLDPDRVIHLGTFSKTLGAGLRLAYMVVPSGMCEKLYQLKDQLHMSTPVLEQAVLARFIREGYFERHVARMKKKYCSKMTRLVKALRDAFGDRIEICGNTTGMHLMVRFKEIVFDHYQKQAIEEAGLSVDYYDIYSLSSTGPANCLVLGYGNLSEQAIEEGIDRLARVVQITRNPRF